jgi:hypothetical protein
VAVGVHTSAANTAGSQTITTPGVTTTTGSTLIAFCHIQGNTFDATTPISDSNGNTWTLLGSDVTYNVNWHARAYKAVNITGGAGHTVTFKGSTTGLFFASFVCEVTGAPASPTVTSAGAEDTTSPYASPSISPATGTVLIGCGMDSALGGAETYTWAGSFASGDKIEEQTDANNNLCGSMAANVQAAGGTFTAQATHTVSTTTAMFVVSVEQSSAAATVAPRRLRRFPNKGPLRSSYDALYTFRQGIPALSAADVTLALVGQAAAFTPGTLAPSTAVPLVGQVGTFNAGTLAPSTAVALTGQSATFTPGALTPSSSVALAGQATIFAPGALAPATDVALAGERATFTPGTLAAVGDVTVALTGISATFLTGVLTPAGGDADTQSGSGNFGPEHFMPMSATIGRVRQEKRKKPPLPVVPTIVEPDPVRAKPALPEPAALPQPYVADLSERLLSTEAELEDLARARRAQLADQEALDALMLLLMTEA